MAEAAFITPTAEMLAPTPGAPVAPAPASAEGLFAGMLAQRLQPSTEPLAKGEAVSVPKPSPLPGEGLPPGRPSPQAGKPLPSQAGAPPAGAEAGTETLAVALPLPLLDGLVPNVDSDGLPLPLAQTDVSTADSPLSGALADTAALPAAPTPSPVTLLDTMPPPAPADRPPLADGRGMQPGLPSTPMTPAQAGPNTVQPLPVTDPRQRPASLGLNARGDAAERLRGSLASLSAEQAQRGGNAIPMTQQTQAGDALSRQFQQQIDRLLATSRGPASSGAGAALLMATDSSASTSADLSATTGGFVLPGIGGGDARLMAVTGPSAVPASVVNTGVGHPGWSAELSQRMVWLANQEIREAKIQLNPRHLGPIDVRIVYSDAQQLSVNFNAQNPAAREALDAALPRLREMFEQQGLNLTDASVSQESFAGRQRDAESDAGPPGHAAPDASRLRADDGEGEWPQQPSPVVIGQGLVDTFA